jgi:cellulose synthase/poly-beta-1,6-N-acetylglucosamine synthase-like glycosyltransferase
MVSLIVPAKNEERVIGNCIDSLLKLNYPKNRMEIIVSMDGSTDRTYEICKSYGKKIRLVRSTPKHCKAEALNEVLPIAKGEILGIYDADCVVSRNCLKYAMKHFENKNVAGVSCALKSSNKNQNIVTRTLSIETCFISYVEHFLQSKGQNSIFFGRNMFIRKAVLNKLGGFDEGTFQEDGELNIKMRRAGYRIDFDTKAIAWTEEPSSIRSFIRQRTRWTRGFWRTLKKHPYKSSGDFVSDIAHGIYFYTSPFLILTLSVLSILFLLKLDLLFASPLLLAIAFNMYLLVKSRIFYKEPLSDLLLLPLLFVMGNILSFLFFKSWFDERGNKKMLWFRPERSGLISK